MELVSEHKNTVLNGKRILFLGSSVTFGAASGGESFVEELERRDGVIAIKEAVSGTTLADGPAAPGGGESYVCRLKRVDPAQQMDCTLVQLSTNDASRNLPLGEVSPGFMPSDFDTETVTGAMESIIRYCRDTWNCPTAFYTGAYFESAPYAAMVRRLYALREKWGIGVIDLYTDTAFNDIDREAYARYMADPIHPTKAGYRDWWAPEIEKQLAAFLAAPPPAG